MSKELRHTALTNRVIRGSLHKVMRRVLLSLNKASKALPPPLTIQTATEGLSLATNLIYQASVIATQAYKRSDSGVRLAIFKLV